MVSDENLQELRKLCPRAQVMGEAGLELVSLPGLKLPPNTTPAEVDALLCLSQHGGYPTRLFLSNAVSGKGGNWSTHCFFGKTWHVWSWNYVPSSQRPIQILAQHLAAFR